MKEEMSDGKDKLIQTGNSGEVYYNVSTGNAHIDSTLGSLECKECLQHKPFQQVRWNARTKMFICLECLETDK
jgi:hypothetical protein